METVKKEKQVGKKNVNEITEYNSDIQYMDDQHLYYLLHICEDLNNHYVNLMHLNNDYNSQQFRECSENQFSCQNVMGKIINELTKRIKTLV